MAPPTPDQIAKFVKHCIQQPQNPLDAEHSRSEWKPGFYEYTVRKGESLKFIASKEASRGSAGGNAPQGFDWKFLCRFNWGVDYPPFVNWSLVDAFGLDETQNLTKDKKNYTFKGGEKLLIPYKPGGAKPGPVAPVVSNVINKRKIRPTAVKGPSIMTPDIESEFTVTGYTVALKEVPDETRKNIKWWKKNITDGGDGEDTAETGETISLKFADGDVGKTFRVFPFIEDKDKINKLIFSEFRVIKVELKHEVARKDMNPTKILETDPINRIHNPAAIVMNASTKETAAKFRLTSVKPDSRNAIDQKFPWPALPANDEGFNWRIKRFSSDELTKLEEKNIPIGEAKFIRTGATLDNTGSECMVCGTKPGYLVLEAIADCAKKPCAWLTAKVVRERHVIFRANRMTAKNNSATVKTHLSVAEIEKVIKITNIYLRQIGVKLEPDTDTDISYIGAGPQQETTTAVNNHNGYFDITNVPNKYVNIVDADAEIASTFNCRPGVINFVFAYQDKTEADTGGYGFGMGPSACRNLHSKPEKGLPLGTALGSMSDKYKGPDETIEPFEHANFKELALFKTPDTQSGIDDKIGILIHNPQNMPNPVPNPYMLPDNEKSEMGATLAHELAHCLALQHRDNGDDGQPVSTKNCMYANDHADGPTDFDLLQLETYRSGILTMTNSAQGNLKVKAFLGKSGKLQGSVGQDKTVSIEVTRNRKRVPGAYMNFWIKGDKRVLKIESISDWDDKTRKMAKGIIKAKFKLARAGNVKLILFAGENDDLIQIKYDCEVSA